MFVLSTLYQLLRGLLVPRLLLVRGNLALCQQLLVLNLQGSDLDFVAEIAFWIALSQLWQNWRSILVIVKPETDIKWHRQGLKCYFEHFIRIY